jgi:hypothetical protein
MRSTLDAVRADPETQALVPLRESIVRKTLIVCVEDVPLRRYLEAGGLTRRHSTE